jgi:dTDP-4-dehydrorhamnose 3,5-epimerase
MIFRETELPGAYIIDLEKLKDERGYFARTWCQKEFEDNGLVSNVVQANTSFNVKAGTLRGMHYQAPPHQETKLVRCIRGALYDVIIDLRPDSSTYMRWTGVELSASNTRMLYVPADFAHGFITLEDNTEVTYLVSESHTPGAERGLRWNDPAFGIIWPCPVDVISDKDAGWSDFIP